MKFVQNGFIPWYCIIKCISHNFIILKHSKICGIDRMISAGLLLLTYAKKFCWIFAFAFHFNIAHIIVKYIH